MDREKAYIPNIIPESDLEMFERANMGLRSGWGKKLSILVIDMTRAFVDDRSGFGCSRTGKPAVKAIRKLLDKTKPIGIPIFYTKGIVGSTPSQYGTRMEKGIGAPPKTLGYEEAAEIADEIAPSEGDVVIAKAKPSAFFGTQLVSLLTYHSVDTLIVTGMTTSGCVRATVVDAFSYNYKVILPPECVADRAEISHQVSLFDMDMKYADVMPLADVLAHLENVDREVYRLD